MKILTYSKLYTLCREHGWKPLFFARKSTPVSSEVLDREIQACLAAGQQKLGIHLLDAVRHEYGEALAHHDVQISSRHSALEGYASPSIILRLCAFLGLHSRQTLSKILARILLAEGLQPAVFSVDHHADLAQQWGLEMKHWMDQDKANLVVRLGDMAAKLNLRHHLIAQSMSSARLALTRINKLIVLKAIQQSPYRSRADYEKALVAEWCLDPECQNYLVLLRKVISFRMRQKNQQPILMEDFSDEVIEQELNKMLLNGLLSSA